MTVTYRTVPTTRRGARMAPKKPTLRAGKELAKVPRGDRRRMSDGKNAWRKMTPQQRRAFLNWIDDEGLKVADDA